MKAICPLAVHCASLCLDIIHNREFEELTHEQINGFYSDLCAMIEARSELTSSCYPRERLFTQNVAEGVIKALHICKDYPVKRDANWLILAMDSRINSTVALSIKT